MLSHTPIHLALRVRGSKFRSSGGQITVDGLRAFMALLSDSDIEISSPRAASRGMRRVKQGGRRRDLLR